MNFKSYQEEDIPNKDAAAAATKKSSLTVGNEGVELKSKSKSKLKRWQTTPGIVTTIVIAIMLFVVVVLSPSSLHGIRGTGSGGGGGGGDASIYFSKKDASHQNHDSKCPTTGSPLEYSNGGSTQTPGVVYYGLDFSLGAYEKFQFPPSTFLGLNQKYVSEWSKVWQYCAGRCNISPSCRTFTVHVKKAGNKKWYGNCFLHDHWLDNRGSNFKKESLNKRSIVSGVCRPEDRWDSSRPLVRQSW